MPSALAFGQGTFVAVNGAGMILTSVDGVRWQDRTARAPWPRRHWGQTALTALAQSSDTLVAVGGYYYPYGSTALILSSQDGCNWSEQLAPAGAGLRAVAFGNGMFVAARDKSTLLTSTDTVNWLPQVVGEDAWLGSLCYGASRFVLSGEVYDTDGHSRTSIWTSDNGQEWVERYPRSDMWVPRIVYGNGRFIAAGVSHAEPVQPAAVLTSPDGLAWLPIQLPVTNLLDIAAGNGVFVATGADYDSGGGWRVVLTSPDGLDWTAHSFPKDPVLNRLAYGRGHFVAIGADNALYSSTDGVHWSEVLRGTVSPTELAFAMDTFWALGDNGAIVQSDAFTVTGPSITRPPLEQTAFAETAASMSVMATGTSPLSYQWFKDGEIIRGATNVSLAFRKLEAQDEGDYFVVVSNARDTAVSRPAHLTVQPLPERGELALRVEDSSVALTLLGKIGRSYEIQATDSLLGPRTWAPVTRIELPAVPFTWTEVPEAPLSRRFYHVVATPRLGSTAVPCRFYRSLNVSGAGGR